MLAICHSSREKETKSKMVKIRKDTANLCLDKLGMILEGCKSNEERAKKCGDKEAAKDYEKEIKELEEAIDNLENGLLDEFVRAKKKYAKSRKVV